MTINQLRYFRELARTEHYGRAAEALYISQPSLSRAIALLEAELNVELFVKQGRSIRLTRAGHVFLEYVEQVLTQLELGVSAMQRFSNRLEVISVGCITPMLGGRPLRDFLWSKAEKASRPRFDVYVSQTEALLQGLKKHKYDLVFCSYNPTEMEAAFVPLIELPFVVAMRADDPLAAYDAVDPRQLAQRELVLNAEPIYSSLIQRILNYYHLSPKVTGSSNEDSVLLRMVEDGLGLMISTDHLQMHAGATVLRPLRQKQFHRYVYLAYLPNIVRTPTVEKILAFAKRQAIPEEGLQPRAADRA